MKIKLGEHEVFENGTIIGTENIPIDFIFNEQTGFIIRMQFQTDLSFEGPKVSASKFEKIGGLFTFFNFDSANGIGNVSPIKIGTFNNRELFLNYRIYSLNKGGKTFHYTWLLGKEVKNAE